MRLPYAPWSLGKAAAQVLLITGLWVAPPRRPIVGSKRLPCMASGHVLPLCRAWMGCGATVLVLPGLPVLR